MQSVTRGRVTHSWIAVTVACTLAGHGDDAVELGGSGDILIVSFRPLRPGPFTD
jgi:hypothetical protein